MLCFRLQAKLTRRGSIGLVISNQSGVQWGRDTGLGGEVDPSLADSEICGKNSGEATSLRPSRGDRRNISTHVRWKNCRTEGGKTQRYVFED